MVEFKADFHCIYIWTWKDSHKKWFDLPYLATDDSIEEVHWPIKWHSSSDLATGTSKSLEKKQKEAAKQKVQQLAKKWKKDVKEKAQVEAKCTLKQKDEQEEHESKRSGKSP